MGGWNFERDGAACFPSAALGALSLLRRHPAFAANSAPGKRLFGDASLSDMLNEGAAGQIARQLIGLGARPVRAIAFDKHLDQNWALDWHQDRTIAVRRRLEVPGFGPWGSKSGQPHVSPPFEIIERMVTLRIHLDPVDDKTAPLRIVPGSHRLGMIQEASITEIVGKLGFSECLAEAGDVWAYATPILHASRPTTANVRRRVLQVDYSRDDLPGGLKWAGIS